MYTACYAILKKLSLNSLKARVVLSILASSLAITLIVIAIFSSYHYKSIYAQVDKDVQANIGLVREPISEALWSFKEETTQFVLTGLVQQPFISAAEIKSETGEVYLVGQPQGDAKYTQQLSYQRELVGTIHVWINNDEINHYIQNSLTNIALIFILSSALITLISIKLFDYMVSRHLIVIARSLKTYNIKDDSVAEISLERNTIVEDELSKIVANLNRLNRDTHNFIKTKQKFEEHLTFQANYDDLTGLPNRRYGLKLLENVIEDCNENDAFSLMFIDLDGFKEINDTHQHLIGDEILKMVADRLKKVAYSYPAHVARMGGDEFMFVVKLTGNDAENLANIIIHTLKAPYKINNDILALSCSIGIAVYPNDADSGTSLIANADTAMFEAKSAGKSQFKTFSANMFEALLYKSQLKNAIGSALDNGEISVCFQPIFAISSSEIVGFESLCRWNHPKFGQVRPDIFIELAEETGDIVKIDRFVLSETVKLLHQLSFEYPKLFGTVNFCPLDFSQEDLLHYISQLLAKYPLESAQLEIEVTERSLLQNDIQSNVQHTLSELDKLDIKIAIDDFGTGYSALSYVKHYRQYISKIKIDRLFIRDMVLDKADAALVNSIIQMAHGLDMMVVAEGIETDAQRTVLQRLGCKFGQGYLVSKPLPYQDFVDLLSETQLV
ncbi:EAL domain-containing protein [Catenovulum sp. 2E275]|uniref:bifunctional diguanylate cyclase/phosphodiesterase n=1 Tax=Catenovulum sp. 2E275 TaxID=2980497 RepID=UPI0021CF171E|nr:bifunctional diguanylate cyclase/phosphodiesterase [Catenovulum sp. 2E275]MCU4677419.1 EAL domain-containing protein [Catenovulum sp. 2E275]